jgi:hypothetical protein
MSASLAVVFVAFAVTQNPVVPDDVSDALVDGRPLDAAVAAEAWHKRAPDDDGALSLLAALYDATVDVENAKRIHALRSTRPKGHPFVPYVVPPAVVDDDDGHDPLYAERYFVAASRLRLRGDTRTDATVVTDMRINEELGLEEAEEIHDWVRVRPLLRSPGDTLTMNREGKVQLRYLSMTPSDAVTLRREGEAASGPLRIHLFERAAAVESMSVDARQALVREALAQGAFAIAVAASTEIAELKGRPSRRHVVALGKSVDGWRRVLCGTKDRPCCMGKWSDAAEKDGDQWSSRYGVAVSERGRCASREIAPSYTLLPHHVDVRQVSLACLTSTDALADRVKKSPSVKALVADYRRRMKVHLPLADLAIEPLGLLDVDGDGVDEQLVKVRIVGTQGDGSMWFSDRAPTCDRVVALARDPARDVAFGPPRCASVDDDGPYDREFLGVVRAKGIVAPAIVVQAYTTGHSFTEVWTSTDKGTALVFAGCGGNG